MPPCLVALLLLAGSVPTMERGVAAAHTGCVVAAPHEGFDAHTGPMARAVGEELGWGWVVARGFRDTRARRWFDVNRPTERAWRGDALQPPAVSEAGHETYARYQALLDEASARPGRPLDLLVELHGHARKVARSDPRRRGEELEVQVIELATRGFNTRELVQLRRAYLRLVRRLPDEDRVLLAIEQLDPVYELEGERIEFYFRASGAKETGALRPERARRVLHFELPQRIRFDERRRALYTELLAELIRPLAR